MKSRFEQYADYQPETFRFEDEAAVQDVLSRYPEYGSKSAVMPLLDLAQRQVGLTGPYGPYPVGGGWIPRAAMDHIAEIIEQPPIKVYEVATFYSMYKLAPIGKYLVQVCGTTPCWLCGATDIIRACEEFTGVHMGETTADGLFTLEEVECLGACVNAPMMQINDDYYEDLTPDIVKGILKALKEGHDVPHGSQKGRKGSMAQNGPTSLQEKARQQGIL